MRITEASTKASPAPRGVLLLNGSTARDAIRGAALGGDAGAIVEHRMDQQAEELSAGIPGAVVERVSEGIQVTFASRFLYDFASDTIRAQAGRNLRTLAVSLQKHPSTDMLIVGHTDTLGDPGYNRDLSARRASSVLASLAKEGVAASRMHAFGMGKLEPVASNWTESGRQANRRIEVAIFADAETRVWSW
jgi:outer membrane protein OmpA-like peptidoglycan-associated protein